MTNGIKDETDFQAQFSIDVELAERLRRTLGQENGGDVLRVETILHQQPPTDSLKSDLAQPAPTSRIGTVPLQPTGARNGGVRSKPKAPKPSSENTRAARTGPKYAAKKTRAQGLLASALSKKYKFRCRVCGLGMSDADTLRRHSEHQHERSPLGTTEKATRPEELRREQATSRDALRIKTASQAGLPSLGKRHRH